jgi:hypothetical protein
VHGCIRIIVLNRKLAGWPGERVMIFNLMIYKLASNLDNKLIPTYHHIECPINSCQPLSADNVIEIEKANTCDAHDGKACIVFPRGKDWL